MLAMSVLALVASTAVEPSRTQRPLVQAIATVRIVSGARVILDGRPAEDLPRPRDSMIRLTPGQDLAQARLVEFE
jgi:hypothetical protein